VVDIGSSEVGKLIPKVKNCGSCHGIISGASRKLVVKPES
jgi:hypothetical protein